MPYKSKDFDMDLNDAVIKQIVDTLGNMPLEEVPGGFREGVMKAVASEAVQTAADVDAKKVSLLEKIKKIIKPVYIYAAASAFCLLLAFIFISPIFQSKSYTGAGDVFPMEGTAEAPAAYPAPAAAPPVPAPTASAASASGAVMESGFDNAASLVQFDEAADYVSVEAEAVREAAVAQGEASPQVASAAQSAPTAHNEPIEQSQKIIMFASYTIDVTDFDKSVGDIQRIAETTSGYVESFNSGIYSTYSTVDGNVDLKSGSICIRVPQAAYQEAKSGLDAIGKVTSSSENIQNITGQYYDAAARLEVKKAEEQRLLELFSKAEKIEDLISLETRLTYVRSDIEAMVAQLNSWDRSVTYSTINVFLNQVIDYTVLPQLDPTLGQKVVQGFNRSAAAFTNSMERLIIGIAENSIAIVIFAVLAIIVLLSASFIKRRNRKF